MIGFTYRSLHHAQCACMYNAHVCKMRMQAQHFVIFCTFDLFAGWKGQKYKFYVLFITREDCGARLASLF